MRSSAKTVERYLAELPEERRAAMEELRATLRDNLPAGFEETLGYGMIGYVVPHSLYPPGYHVDPSKPLPFINLASQKNYIALYHMGLNADPALQEWFATEYPRHSRTRLDMGKSCIRFKRIDDIPYALIADLARRMDPARWIETYESALPHRTR